MQVHDTVDTVVDTDEVTYGEVVDLDAEDCEMGGAEKNYYNNYTGNYSDDYNNYNNCNDNNDNKTDALTLVSLNSESGESGVCGESGDSDRDSNTSDTSDSDIDHSMFLDDESYPPSSIVLELRAAQSVIGLEAYLADELMESLGIHAVEVMSCHVM